ncbi:MAG: hemolysin III family protein [Variibacter sp.]
MTDFDGRPVRFVWRYTRAEIIADGVVHALGVALGLVGAVVLLVLAADSSGAISVVSAAVYATGLITVLGLSAAYNLWPVSRLKWWLRRLDHSAIYLLIAATYTPFLLHLKGGLVPFGMLAAIWLVATAGIVVKLVLPGRFDRVAVVLYLLLGWSGVLLYDSIVSALSPTTLILLAAGGTLYSVGVIFHVWQSLRFQNAIWHGFVLVAALCHYFAVLETVAFAAPA